MTVKELIAALNTLDPDLEVLDYNADDCVWHRVENVVINTRYPTPFVQLESDWNAISVHTRKRNRED